MVIFLMEDFQNPPEFVILLSNFHSDISFYRAICKHLKLGCKPVVICQTIITVKSYICPEFTIENTGIVYKNTDFLSFNEDMSLAGHCTLC